MKKRMVSIIVVMLLIFSTVSVYASPGENGQTGDETNSAAEISQPQADTQTVSGGDIAGKANQVETATRDNMQQGDTQGEPSANADNTASDGSDGEQQQEKKPITIPVDLGEHQGTLTIQEDESGHEAQFSMKGNATHAVLELERDEKSGEWSVTKCDTYDGHSQVLQSVLRVAVAVAVGCSVSFLGLAIITKSRR